MYLFADQPEMTLYPSNATEIEGNNITLSCNATGNPEPTISWTIKRTRRDMSYNPKISFSPEKRQLIITNVNRTDSGEYRCVASNILGNATSHVATLDVQCKYI